MDWWSSYYDVCWDRKLELVRLELFAADSNCVKYFRVFLIASATPTQSIHCASLSLCLFKPGPGQGKLFFKAIESTVPNS